ncbi:murein L,D-transpeptidase catalytic domain-containing protein [Flavobacterium sp. LS2P90]|uniref:Murein L,D-transpeptidase catalytic domain-containing protein n=1 Tax=Flavobacterium xylosi TaxID=3230415 RepID=A0ABW6HRK0_9FLAO
MRRIVIALIFIGTLLLSFTISSKDLGNKTAKISELTTSAEEKLLKHVTIIKELVRTNPNYNNEIAFFVDMEIMSGKNRFFIYDLKKNKIIDQGLVAQGFGSRVGPEGKLKFSNENNSLCTSLGKYAIGNSYNGQYGKAYKLHGLDPTNDNAFARNIVLHKNIKMPYGEQDKPIGYSFGCPMVNDIYYSRIEKLVDNSKRNIVLDIYF